MSSLNQALQQAHDAAAAAQLTQRAKRRVIRRNLTPRMAAMEPDAPEGDDFEQATGQGIASSPSAAAGAPTALVSADDPAPALPHTAITVSPLDLPAEQFRAGLDRRGHNRQLLMKWLRSALVDGVDFGRVHIASKERCELARVGRAKECANEWHWSKYSLFKPGAEKITGMLGMTVHYPSLPEIEAALLSGAEIKTLIMRCELHDAAGHVVAEGVGARSLAQDYGDFNKSLKMAEKSAHIDATLRLAGLSEVFTQDVEDVAPGTEDTDSQPGGNGKADPNAPPASPPRGKPRDSFTMPSPMPDVASPEDIRTIRARIAQHRLDEGDIRAWLKKSTRGKVTCLEQLSKVQSAKLLRKIDAWAAEHQTA